MKKKDQPETFSVVPPGAAWRLLDTGARPAAENIALDAALLQLRAAGDNPNTLRFLQFSPAAVLIGYHQTLAQEVRGDYCQRQGIEVNRRITGGGAVYFDRSQLGWELIAARSEVAGGATLAALTARLCQGVVRGLRQLGVGASFRPRNDIEVAGRKICGTGGVYEEGAFLFQGSLLIDFDVEAMLKALRIPREKLSRHELSSARERVTCLAQQLPQLPPLQQIKAAIASALGAELGVELKEAGLTPAEAELGRELLDRYSSSDWLYEVSEPPGQRLVLESMHQAQGGLIRSSLAVDLPRRRLKSALFSGDFFISPRRTVYDLEAHLKDKAIDKLEGEIEDFFADRRPETLDLSPQDFWLSLRGSLDKLEFPDWGISLAEANDITVVGSNEPLDQVLGRVGVLLLPYCSKLKDCEFRTSNGCKSCGGCSFGYAYALAREKGLTPITVRNYEHLEAVFAACRANGVGAYIGCCCQAFLLKRHRAFATAGLAGVLVDIENTTCYDLGQEEQAYRGEFADQTELKLSLLEKLLEQVPPQAPLLGLAWPSSQEAAPGDDFR